MKFEMSRCRRRLATLWFSGAGALFVLLILQSILGRYAERTTDAWSWFLPTIMPTLSLIIGVLVADALGQHRTTVRMAEPFLFRLTFVVSSAYLLGVCLVILLKPFSALGPIELMTQSNLWLGPLQGLAVASLGAFFVKSPDSRSSAPSVARPESR
jgi:hypothetical protein